MTHKDYCSKCKTKNVPLIKYAKTKNFQFYRCRPCVNEHIKKYRQTIAGRLSVLETQRKMYVKYPERAIARQLAFKAVKSGKIPKSQTCQVCSSGGRIEGHHPDYSKPTEVIWACPPCHATYH